MKRILDAAFYLASSWSLLIVSLVVLGNNWALPRAAGGQFESFPTWLRIVYLFNLTLISLQIYVYAKSKLRFLNLFFYLSCLSAAVNLFSRSPLERWNALAAATSAFGIFMLRREFSQKNSNIVT